MRISNTDLAPSADQAEAPGLSSEETLQAESLEGAAQRLTCADRRVQRQDAASGSVTIFDEITVQRLPAGDASTDVAPDAEAEIDAMRGSGAPLDQETRAFMEPRFGHTFNQVRIHTDARAASLAHALDALAFTVGNDIAFAPGQYQPGSDEGRTLLAHELTHTLQQTIGAARVQRQEAEGGTDISTRSRA